MSESSSRRSSEVAKKMRESEMEREGVRRRKAHMDDERSENELTGGRCFTQTTIKTTTTTAKLWTTTTEKK